METLTARRRSGRRMLSQCGAVDRRLGALLFCSGLVAYFLALANTPEAERSRVEQTQPISTSVALAQTGNPTADLARLQADDGQWIMPAKNYASTRYSGLNRITTENVKQLKPVCVMS